MQATINDLRLLPEVPFTKTWKPYSHFSITNNIRVVLSHFDMNIRGAYLELNKNKQNLYGTFDVEYDNEYSFILGFRNSTDKSFGFGLCSGCRVLVCSNGCFDGEFKIVNIHNNTLTLEKIYEMIMQATIQMKAQSAHTMEWLNALKSLSWSVRTTKACIFDLLSRGAIPPTKFKTFMGHYYQQEGGNFPMSPYKVQGAVTRFYRQRPLHIQHDRVNQANKIIGYYV